MELSEYSLYSLDMLQWSKNQIVKTPEKCIEVEEKIKEMLVKRKEMEEKKDEKLKPTIQHLSCAINFATKAYNSYARVEKELQIKRDQLEEARKRNTERLKDSQDKNNGAKPDAEMPADPVTVKSQQGGDILVEKKKRGRPRKT